eukprot:1188544-Prorocentrum_minimum.AAC.2
MAVTVNSRGTFQFVVSNCNSTSPSVGVESTNESSTCGRTTMRARTRSVAAPSGSRLNLTVYEPVCPASDTCTKFSDSTGAIAVLSEQEGPMKPNSHSQSLSLGKLKRDSYSNILDCESFHSIALLRYFLPGLRPSPGGDPGGGSFSGRLGAAASDPRLKC